MAKKTINISAGFPHSFTVKISRAAIDSEQYADITDPSDVPASDWALCFVDSSNKPQLSVPIDWTMMDENGLLLITLTADQTLAHAGRKLRLEVRNSAGTSDLMDEPGRIVYFVPNNLHD